METFLSRLEWRFATKKFDPTRKVADADLKEIIKAVRFAPTSYGIQPFHVVIVNDPGLKRELRKASYDQPQVTDCSELFVFCVRTDIEKRGEEYADLATKNNPLLNGNAFKKSIADFAEKKRIQGLEAWTARQAYIALGFGLAACAELGIDSCPMEGFEPEKVDRILKSPEYLKSVAYLAIGYRKEGPAHPKTRFPENDLFTTK